MYSFKEKAKFLRELGHTSHAEKDLHLLKLLDPRSNLIEPATNFPSRYAEKVLYALLDLTTIEEIRKNRRDIDNQKENNETPGTESNLSGAEGTGTEEQPGIQDEKDSENNQSTKPTENSVTENPDAEKEDLKEQLEETEAERDEAIEEKEDLEEQLEEKETELETVKSELEEEKKSEETPKPKAPAKPASSKKKKSTPK